MTAVITLLAAGTGTGPFYLYSNVDGFTIPFASNISKASLVAGYPTGAIPLGTTLVRIKSLNDECNNYIDVIVPPQTCYNFLPTDSYYLIDYIIKPTTSYFYGSFSGYEENDISTSYKNLIKLNADLTIDTGFNVGIGFDEILYTGASILEQPDGKIIVTGTFITYQGISKNRIVRLNTDASIDATFIIGTGFNGFTQSPGIDSNGSIIVTGIYSDYNGTPAFRIARLLSNGAIDPTFITGSGFNNTTTDVLVNPDNSMFILGYFNTYKGVVISSPGIIKLLENGSVDISFNAGIGIDPYLPNNANYFARIPGETSFYIAGYLTEYNSIAVSNIVKVNMDGTIDTSFNTGTGFDGTNIYAINVIWEDKLLVEGDFLNYNGVPSNYAIILNADGTIYYTFDLVYRGPVVIGNTLFAAEDNACLQLLHTFVPPTCTPLFGTATTDGIITTTTTTVAPTTTTTTTVAPLGFGALYNGYAVTDVRNVAPVGFHVPTRDEFYTLLLHIESSATAISNTVGSKLKEVGAQYWSLSNVSTNVVGFNARGAGTRGTDGVFALFKDQDYIWNTNETNVNFGQCSQLLSSSTLFETYDGTYTFSERKYKGNSLRFVADSGTPTTVTGNDGKIYPCVTIGTQTWTAVNSNETKYRNGDWIHGYDGGIYTPISNIDWAALITEGMCYYNDDENYG